jgi:hypothetical protein
MLVAARLLDQPQRALILAAWYGAMAASLYALAIAGADFASAAAAGFAAGAFLSSAPLILYGLAPAYYPVRDALDRHRRQSCGRPHRAIVGPLFASALLGMGLGTTSLLLSLLPLVAIACVATLAVLARPTVAD